MSLLENLAVMDIMVLALLGLASVRGVKNGLVREACSLAAIAAAFICVWMFTEPLSVQLEDAFGEGAQKARGLAPLGAENAAWLGPKVTLLLTGLVIGFGALMAVGMMGRVLARGVRLAGLGFWDHAVGGLFGFLEGAIVIAAAMSIAGGTLGMDHPLIANSFTLQGYEWLTQRVDAATGLEALPLPEVPEALKP